MVSLKNGYHGVGGAAHLTNIGPWNHNIPRTMGAEPACFPDSYRGDWVGEDAGKKFAKQVKDTKDFNTSGKVALFIAEAIQGAGGIHCMPKGFVEEAAKHARKAGGLYVADEVQTGFARTGTGYWGFEAFDTTPDIVVMAKTIGNGMPLAAIATTKEIASSIDKVTFSTYAANPLAVTAGREVLKIIDEEGLQENSRVRGE